MKKTFISAMILLLLCSVAAMAQNSTAETAKRSLAAYNAGDYDTAIKGYTELIKLYPNMPQAYAMRGMAYQKKKDCNKAIPDLTEASRLFGQSRDKDINVLYHTRGKCYLTKNDYDKAVADFETALLFEPELIKDNKFMVDYGLAKELSDGEND